MSDSRGLDLFLAVLGVVFVAYGLFCFVQPGFLAGAAGVTATSPTGVTELRAMYGGLQTGFGVLLLAAARDRRLRRSGVAVLAFLVPGLAIARATGSTIDGGLTSYTVGALVFEISTSVAAVVLLRREIETAAA